MFVPKKYSMDFNIPDGDKKKVGVYTIKNKLNGKFYVGSTSNSFYNRYHQHLNDYRKQTNSIPILHRAFRKHGVENFEFSILCICSKEDCVKMEQFYIDNGTDYNSSLVAGSLLNYRHPIGAKTRTVIRGEHHSSKPVHRFTLDGVFDKSFSSFIEALEDVGKTKKGSSHIKQSCLGKTFSAFGYRWSLDKDNLPMREKRVPKISTTIILNKDNEEWEFKTQLAASNFIKSLGFKCNQSRIHRSILTGERVYGFTITSYKSIPKQNG